MGNQTGVAQDAVLESLARLGFSAYDAKVYVGLVAAGEPRTGYALAKSTTVPHPKVYETLRRLEGRGAALRLAGDPVRYVAVEPDRLMVTLEAEYASAVAEARRDLEYVSVEASSSWMGVRALEGQASTIAAAAEMIEKAERRVYLSAHTAQLADLVPQITQSTNRGVDFVVVHFGPLPEGLPQAHAYGHHSTDGTVYRRHQARHLALVVDSQVGLWGIAPDGRQWSCAVYDEAWMAALVKGYILHDLYFQRVYGDFRDELQDRYGPSLNSLRDFEPSGLESREAGPAGLGLESAG